MKTMRLTALSLLLAATAFAQATVVTKEGTGEAAIANKDEQKAFDEAKEKALRNAVEQAAGVRIDSDTAVINNQLVRDQVFANTTGFVKKYDLVSKKAEKNVMTVVVKADVITDNLDKDIQAAKDLIKRAGRPSIMVLINEQTLQTNDKGTQAAVTTSDTLATVLSQTFKADGWDIKDPSFANGKVRVAAGATLGAAEAKEIGDISKAAFILYGSVTMRNHEGMAGNDGKQITFPVTGEYDLTVFATDVGSQIGKFSGKLMMGRPGEAEGQVATKMLISYERSSYDVIMRKKDDILAPLRGAVLEHFRNRQVNGAEVSLAVTGLENFGAAKDFKRAIESLKGIKEAEQKDFTKGKAMYRITYLGTPQQLAEAVEAVTFKKKKLDVTGVTANSVDVNVGK